MDPLLLALAWTAESDDVSARFGQSVASAGDVNGDGFADVVVGALLYGSKNEGRATVYLGSESGLATTQYLTHRLRETYDQARRTGVPVTRSHGLLVVDVALDELSGWQRLARSAAMGRALTQTFGEGHPMVHTRKSGLHY